MKKFIVILPSHHSPGVFFINDNENQKYKSFLNKLNSLPEVGKFNGDDSYNFTDIKTFLHKVKEDFESEFQNLDLYEYEELKSNFRIIVPYLIHKDLIKELEKDFEFKGCL